MFKIEQNGRSMVEMLGVLAIIGVLSIGGIAGYRYAMDKHEANEARNIAEVAIVEAMVATDAQKRNNSDPDSGLTGSVTVQNRTLRWETYAGSGWYLISFFPIKTGACRSFLSDLGKAESFQELARNIVQYPHGYYVEITAGDKYLGWEHEYYIYSNPLSAGNIDEICTQIEDEETFTFMLWSGA